MVRTSVVYLGVVCCLVVCLSTAISAEAAGPPVVGDEAQDFELKSLQGDLVKLSNLAKTSPVVLLVLRGYPGYQCPICSKQIGEFISQAKKFADVNAQVVIIYPGPTDQLAVRADEFIRGKTLPENFHFVIDPDYSFVNAYNLRWDAPRETAYPSTFLIDAMRRIRYAKVSMTHGGRTSAAEVLAELAKVKSGA